MLKHYILYNINKECQHREANGEPTPFKGDFEKLTQKYAAILAARREQEKQHHEEAMKAETPVMMERIQTKKKTSPKRSRSSNQNVQSISVQKKLAAQGIQPHCCIKECQNIVTNRLRFSLRCHTTEDFIPEFLDKEWNKVCHYHYFSDLYQFKKRKTQDDKLEKAITAAKKKNTVTKRKRDYSPMQQTASPKRVKM